MQNVLVPFDGSSSAKRAIQYLVDFSAEYPAIKVHVINVQSEPKLYGNYVSASMLEQLHDGALQHGQDINTDAAAMLEAANINFETHAVIGEVIGEVVKAVKQLGCNTVVMGTRGMSNLGNLVMGSVATRIVHEVPVPVLLIK
ncbi:universal stress protein [Halopseudomonas salegens]|uniref:Nucleotide-binding universal stress protein, UspA family n=1 Tax=Halopseudomonas salegens TaxID=1434072 RepID=A0A1H2FPP5_9GAMM|nr:universal stress protein [Halopseudomonas salegens]SDU09275.1 Nucleotide-binding universal stress protein, UspA family [Halopseudomonas salegens]